MKNITEYIQVNESATAILVGQIMALALTLFALHDYKKPEAERFHPIDTVKKWLQDKKIISISNKIANDKELSDTMNAEDKGEIWNKLSKKLSKEELDYLEFILDNQ